MSVHLLRIVSLVIMIVTCVTVSANADGAYSNAGFYFMQNKKITDEVNGSGYFLLSKTEVINNWNGDIIIVGGNAVIEGNVNGNVYIWYGTASFGKNASVSGNVLIVSSTVSIKDGCGIIAKPLFGSVDIFFVNKVVDGDTVYKNIQPYYFVVTAMGLLQTLFGGLILILYRKKYIQSAMVIVKAPKKVAVYGSVLVFMILAIAIIFALSVVGFPIAILFCIVYIILVTVGQVSLAIFTGILLKQQNLLLCFLLGSFVIGIIKIIPFLYTVINIVVLPVFCIGAIAVTFVNRYYLRVYYTPVIALENNKNNKVSKSTRDLIIKGLKEENVDV